MAACVRAVQQADGSLVLSPDPAAADLTACPYVVQSGAEIGNSLFSMTAEDGGIFSAGVISCWMAAYGVRVLIDLFKNGSSKDE